MVKPQSPSPASRDGLINILKNMGWLIGGKGFAAICSLVYLAILSRSLGIRDFGHFSLIFGTAQALVAVAGFQTWQTLVRFGAQPLHDGDLRQFGRLAWLCGLMDVSGAIVGTVAAFVIYYGFGQALHLNPRYIDMAFAFSCALLWSRMTTPNGIVRVLDRFDIGSYVEAIVPAGRLLASLIILLTGPSVAKFLFAWALFDLLSAAVYWVAAHRLVPEVLHRSNFGHWRRALRENQGIISFFGVTYGASTLDALFKQGPLLAVGYFIGTSAAGIYRLADQIAQSIGKLAQLVGRAVFPEFVNAQIRIDRDDFRRLVRQVTYIAAAGGVIVTVIAVFLGGPLLGLVGGKAFTSGADVLLPLAIAASFELAAVTYVPMLYATGHPVLALAARTLALSALVATIALVASQSEVGIAWSVAASQALAYLAMSFTVWLVLRGIDRRSD